MGPGENPGLMCIMLPPGPPFPPPPIMPIIPGGMSLGWWCIMLWLIMPPSEVYIGSPQLGVLHGTDELLVSCWLICAMDEIGSKLRLIDIWLEDVGVAGFSGWLSWHGRFGFGDIPPGPMFGPLNRGPPIPGLGIGNLGWPPSIPGVRGPPGLGIGNFCDLSLGVPDRAIRCC
jgi:hypothetical protein